MFGRPLDVIHVVGIRVEGTQRETHVVLSEEEEAAGKGGEDRQDEKHTHHSQRSAVLPGASYSTASLSSPVMKSGRDGTYPAKEGATVTHQDQVTGCSIHDCSQTASARVVGLSFKNYKAYNITVIA